MPSQKTSSGKRFAAPPARSACTSWFVPRSRKLSLSVCPYPLTYASIAEHRESDAAETLRAAVPAEDVRGGFLPSLYGDNLEEFCFDDIFGGPSDDALESFFTGIFSIPSFPRAKTADGPVLKPLPYERPVARGYRSDDDVIRAYYELIHPAFPILPPPLEELSEDANHISEPWAPNGQFFSDYEPTSPLVLALLSVLTLLPHANNEHDLAKDSRECRATFAQSLAQCALESIKIGATLNRPTCCSLSPSAFHPNVPAELEAPLAYCVLSLYQYLHRGEMTEMVHFANEAYDACVLLSLHQFAEENNVFMEAVRRTWWMTYVSICFSATITCKPPTRPTDISKFTTPYPTTGITSTVRTRSCFYFQVFVMNRSDRQKSLDWIQYIRAEETLVAATLLLVALVTGSGSDAATPAFRRSLSFMNTVIDNQLSCLSVYNDLESSADISPEDRLMQSLRAMTLIRLMSARIKTHRYCAMMSHPSILKKFEAVPSWRAPHELRQSVFTGLNVEGGNLGAQLFPFACQDSLNICVDSALGIVNCLASLRKDLHIAPFACSALLAGYTLMMISFFQNYSPEEGVYAISVAELQGRCKYAVNASIDTLEHFAIGFDFIKLLKDQLQTAAIACEMR
ncbi:hypothetical protein FOBRF1_006997 [Fusarium oxysporum]